MKTPVIILLALAPVLASAHDEYGDGYYDQNGEYHRHRPRGDFSITINPMHHYRHHYRGHWARQYDEETGTWRRVWVTPEE
jgi:hypothetical protein